MKKLGLASETSTPDEKVTTSKYLVMYYAPAIMIVGRRAVHTILVNSLEEFQAKVPFESILKVYEVVREIPVNIEHKTTQIVTKKDPVFKVGDTELTPTPSEPFFPPENFKL